MRKTTEMEYVDAPSGFVTLYNYKEPFMKFEGGFGFQGVLLVDGVSGNVQCHLCGNWFNYLPHHLLKEHGMRAYQYKAKVGLNIKSALLSEKARQNLIAGSLEVRMRNLRINKKHSKKTRAKISQSMKDSMNRMEFKNNRGTCPLQLIKRLQTLAEKLGQPPSQKECSFHTTVEAVFGSWAEGLRRAGIQQNKVGVNYKHATKKVDGWDDKTLLEMLVAFKEQHGRYPAMSDCRRNLLPSSSTYRRHFKTWLKARKIAFPELTKTEERRAMDEVRI